MLSGQTPTRQWNTRRTEKARRLASVPVQGKVLPTGDLVAMLEKLIAPGDKVVLEGNNQKQADFLSRSLAEVNPQIVHDLHMIMPSVGRSEHLDIFEKGIARKLDFSFSGTQSLRISQLLEDAIMTIIDAKDESDIDSFFGGGQTTFLSGGFSGLDDFELICFMVVIK